MGRNWAMDRAAGGGLLMSWDDEMAMSAPFFLLRFLLLPPSFLPSPPPPSVILPSSGEMPSARRKGGGGGLFLGHCSAPAGIPPPPPPACPSFLPPFLAFSFFLLHPLPLLFFLGPLFLLSPSGFIDGKHIPIGLTHGEDGSEWKHLRIQFAFFYRCRRRII